MVDAAQPPIGATTDAAQVPAPEGAPTQPPPKQLVKGSGAKHPPTHFHKKTEHEEDGTDAWLMTYADMITLILCFFVIMLSVSEPKTEKFEKLKQQLTGGFIEKTVEIPLKSTFQEFQKIIEDQAVERDASVERHGNVIQFEMGGNMLFEAGSATLKPEAYTLIDKMVVTLLNSGMKNYTVDVEGHTDNTAVTNAQFASNWELSAARSAAVVRLMLEKGIAAPALKVVGFADTRPKQNVPNTDAYGNDIPENQAQNRRVVIRIESKN
jgi:chemotaxis protein MotB